MTVSMADLEPSRTSTMTFFAKTVKGFWPLTIFAKRFIVDIQLGSKHASESFVLIFLVDTNINLENIKNLRY